MATAIQSLARLSALPPPAIDRRLSLAVFELTNSTRPRVVFALPFAEQVRRALIRNRADTFHYEAITGKTVDGVPLEGHEHAHYFATDEDGDGRLDHVTIYCPRGFDAADVEALGSLCTIYRHGNRAEVRMLLIGLGVSEPRAVATGSQAQLEGYVALAAAQGSDTGFQTASAVNESSVVSVPRAVATGLNVRRVMIEADRDVCVPRLSATINHPLPQVVLTSRRWRSVTPFSLPRFPNRGGGKPPRPRDLPEAQLIRELKSRGLPEPILIRRIEGYQPNGRPMVRWFEFHTQRFKGTHGKGLAGFEIEFGEPVSGPIALGFGCHFGLGLFEPC